MSNSNYSIGLQPLKPIHTAYGAICMPIRKLNALDLGMRRKWPRPIRLPPETETRPETLTIFLETRRWYVSRPFQDRDVETETTTLYTGNANSNSVGN